MQLASAAGAAAHIWRGGRAQSGYDRRSTRATGLDLAGEGGRLARPSRAPERAEGQGGGRGHRRCHIVARGDRERGWGREREREPAGATGRSASGWNEDRREILGMREDPDRKLQKRMQRPKEAAQWCFFLHFAYARRDGVRSNPCVLHVYVLNLSGIVQRVWCQ